jgi:hypothetical protein
MPTVIPAINTIVAMLNAPLTLRTPHVEIEIVRSAPDNDGDTHIEVRGGDKPAERFGRLDRAFHCALVRLYRAQEIAG